MKNAIQRIREENEHGFTLTEMMVTVSIMLIVTIVAVNGFTNQRKQSIDATVENDVKSAALKVETWKVTNPNGVPSDSIVSENKSEKDTIITLVNLGDGTYEIRGFNPRGNITSQDPGYVYNSLSNGL